MSPDQSIWEEELVRAMKELEQAQKYDDQGSIQWAEERIRWSKMKIREYEDMDKSRKKGA